MIRRFVLSTFTHARSMCTDINGTASGGLYGISKHLKSPHDFNPFYSESRRRCNELINFICSKNLPPTSTIQAFDEILGIVFTFTQTADLCMSMTTYAERITALKTRQRMTLFYTELCRNPALSQAVKRLESEKHLLSEEDQMFVRKLKISFENEGSFLCPDKREQLDHLNHKIDCLSSEYKTNIDEKYSSVDIYPSSRIDEEMLQDLDNICRLGQKGFRIPTDRETLYTVLEYPLDDEILKNVYISGFSTPLENLKVMMQLVDARREKAQVASYFSLSNCIEGFKIIVKSLFGATIHVMKPASGEILHDDVIKLFLHHPDEGDWGFIYLDVFERREKVPAGSMLRRLRNRRMISPTKYQIPVVVIVCDFPFSLDEKLFHCDVKELFHEFGHALHCLLSRTDRSLVHGTQLVFDLLEVPSILFEYYANDYRVLRMFARHKESAKKSRKS